MRVVRFRLHGRAVQVDPIKPTLKAPGTKRLKLKYDKLLSSFAFNFNLRRYYTCASDSDCFAQFPCHGKAVQVDPVKTRVESAWN